MIELELRSPIYHADEARVEWKPVLHIRVETQDHCAVTGDLRYLDLNAPVLNRRTGAPVRAEDDLEEWVRNLAQAYARAGDLAVVVLDDTNPLPEPNPADFPAEDPVQVPDHSEVGAY